MKSTTSRFGRPPKGGGDRAQLIARVPTGHAEHYREQAAQMGIPLSDYVALKLAEGAGLPVPAYIADQLAAKLREAQDTLLAS